MVTVTQSDAGEIREGVVSVAGEGDVKSEEAKERLVLQHNHPSTSLNIIPRMYLGSHTDIGTHYLRVFT